MNFRAFFISTTLTAMAVLTPPFPAWSQGANIASGYRQVERNLAQQQAIPVTLQSGRMSAIDFSHTDETIFYIGLADPSRVVYNTDLPLDGGSAKTVFLRPIQPLQFPHATTAKITNLAVKTIDRQGRQRLYNFNILHDGGNSSQTLGIHIVPYVSGESVAIRLDGDRTASFNDIELGLNLAIRRGYTSANDPVVGKVRRFLALARNGVPVQEAAQRVEIPFLVLSELGKIALEYRPLETESREIGSHALSTSNGL